MGVHGEPVIIMGMHRSGTSMVTKMLRGLGLFVGWDLHTTYEAMFFLKRNEKILNICNGGWDNPRAIENLLSNSGLRRSLICMLSSDLASWHVMSYLGPRLFLKYKSVLNLDVPWGWKDPRNTFVLPIWLEIFPRARIIHVYRNGIDVAQSLVVREADRLRQFVGSNRHLGGIVAKQIGLVRDKGWGSYLMNKVYDICRKGDPLSKYDKFKIYSCISLEKSFQLWCTYVEKAFGHADNIENQVFNVKYEEFIMLRSVVICQELCPYC